MTQNDIPKKTLNINSRSRSVTNSTHFTNYNSGLELNTEVVHRNYTTSNSVAFNRNTIKNSNSLTSIVKKPQNGTFRDNLNTISMAKGNQSPKNSYYIVTGSDGVNKIKKMSTENLGMKREKSNTSLIRNNNEPLEWDDKENDINASNLGSNYQVFNRAYESSNQQQQQYNIPRTYEPGNDLSRQVSRGRNDDIGYSKITIKGVYEQEKPSDQYPIYKLNQNTSDYNTHQMVRTVRKSKKNNYRSHSQSLYLTEVPMFSSQLQMPVQNEDFQNVPNINLKFNPNSNYQKEQPFELQKKIANNHLVLNEDGFTDIYRSNNYNHGIQ